MPDMALRILFVEDHDDTRQTVSRLLRHFAYEVVTARDYQAARAILDQCHFDVLLSDIGLPDGNGCDLVIEGKAKQRLVGIALTAYGTAREVERGVSCSFDHYFVKPLDIYRLRATLEGITAQRS
jgi:Response regulator containing CheY-like receiver, AAA-type ATPase, and DNA-binding domains